MGILQSPIIILQHYAWRFSIALFYIIGEMYLSIIIIFIYLFSRWLGCGVENLHHGVENPHDGAENLHDSVENLHGAAKTPQGRNGESPRWVGESPIQG